MHHTSNHTKSKHREQTKGSNGLIGGMCGVRRQWDTGQFGQPFGQSLGFTTTIDEEESHGDNIQSHHPMTPKDGYTEG